MSKQVSLPWSAFEIPGDRLKRWCVIGTSAGRGKPVIADDIRAGDYARLIAAAPELLEALKEAASFVDRHSESWYTSGQELIAKIDSAIAKATGTQ